MTPDLLKVLEHILNVLSRHSITTSKRLYSGLFLSECSSHSYGMSAGGSQKETGTLTCHFGYIEGMIIIIIIIVIIIIIDNNIIILQPYYSRCGIRYIYLTIQYIQRESNPFCIINMLLKETRNTGVLP